MADNKLTTFSPDAARLIARFVADAVRTTGRRGNDAISGVSPATKVVFAKITDVAAADENGVVLHTWNEVRWNFTDEDWEDAPDGRKGDDFVSSLIAPDPATALSVGLIVLAVRLSDPTTGADVWVAIAGGGGGNLLTPQRQGMFVGAAVANSLSACYPFPVAVV